MRYWYIDLVFDCTGPGQATSGDPPLRLGDQGRPGRRGEQEQTSVPQTRRGADDSLQTQADCP